DLLIDRATLAEQIHDLRQRDELIERVALYDANGSRRARWSARGRVVVHAPEGATIALEPAGASPGGPDMRLAPGSYIVVVSMPEHLTVKAPILVERAREIVLEITPPRTEDVPTDFIYVPPGEFLFGNDSDSDRQFLDTTPQHRRSTDAYLIARTE